jgi:hypothetical protein
LPAPPVYGVSVPLFLLVGYGVADGAYVAYVAYVAIVVVGYTVPCTWTCGLAEVAATT